MCKCNTALGLHNDEQPVYTFKYTQFAMTSSLPSNWRVYAADKNALTVYLFHPVVVLWAKIRACSGYLVSSSHC